MYGGEFLGGVGVCYYSVYLLLFCLFVVILEKMGVGGGSP